MTLSELTQTQHRFLTILEAFSAPVPVDIAADLSGISVADLHTLVRKSLRAGWLTESGDNLLGISGDVPEDELAEIRGGNTPNVLGNVLKEIMTSDLAEHLPENAYNNLLARCDQNEEVAELAYRASVKEMEEGHTDSALEHLHSCLRHLEGRLSDSKNAGMYIMATQRIIGLTTPRHKALDLVEEPLIRACEVANEMGDRRNRAFLSLYQGYLIQDRDRIPESADYLKTGLEAVESLGDEEITSRAADFYGYYYYSRGLILEASRWFERARSHETIRDLELFRNFLNFPILFAHTAAFNGQFYRAVGILQALLLSASKNRNFAQARFCTASLGGILLMMGNQAEAARYLEESLEEARSQSDIETAVYALRALAWLYFQEGDIRRSYVALRDCLKEVEEIASPHTFFIFPWNLELLFEFHKVRYKPGIEEMFEKEMAYAEKGFNVMMRGVAQRIRAQLADINGEGFGTVRSLLESSISDLIRSNNPIELAKTRAELSRQFLKQGEMARARDEATQASLTFGYEGFPEELKPLIRSMGLAPAVADLQRDWLSKYIELISGLVPSSNENETMSGLISSTIRFFESERGGIFRFDENSRSPVLVTGSNLTAEDVSQQLFLSKLALIRKAHEEDRPVLESISIGGKGAESRESHVLCLPFHSIRLPNGVLYFDNTWSEGIHQTLAPAVLAKMTRQLATYLDTIESFSSNMKEISRQAIVQSARGDGEKNEIITRDRGMEELLASARQVAPSEAPVLIQGETGVGKELMARFVHDNSQCANMPFIAVNFASIPESLLESELFGHEKGAFTGAVSRKPGLMELADKGTLFMDEVGDIPKSIQVKLLRALQEKSFMRVGGVREYQSDFRIVAATNRDMPSEVAQGSFREDLYYRINIVTLDIPPLRERSDDIIDLAEYFLKRYARFYNRTVPELTIEDSERLLSYQWPGNIRELRNVIERAVLLSGHDRLEFSIPGGLSGGSQSSESASGPVKRGKVSFPDDISLDEMQRRYIEHILQKTGGKMGGDGSASEILGLNRSTLYSRMRKFGIIDSLDFHRR